ncbi:TLP18.3, Psb32 and MOLO-1 founding protein of phosphatase [Actinopolyspora xinjiangensis]|uniref:TLP18.3, Psb32 and MOLO-1 founding protein of phosphatase n=1 Tax=Actinopolyspora xinjiangensis TaxID=405564 RepID=A0A1H0U6J3_9ACTN|nr:DUF5130 family protein [Actinopolyspora xinjiangensis]SDP61771.1 TLP18.3, Psb32 and MOLO-1 founding protein of phosphatase [Actinopolyspora xinjiangensis]
MATGEMARTAADVNPAELEAGHALTAGGRLSIARRIEPERPKLPFSPGQLARLDEALTLSTRTTGLEFAIYLGDLGERTRERAEQIHAGLGERAPRGVLIAVSPAQRCLEVVTGEQAHRRIPDRTCNLAVMGMVASFKEGDLIEGLINALRMLSEEAGTDFEAAAEHH